MPASLEPSNPWKYMCERWELLCPPSRPSTFDMRNYSMLLVNTLQQMDVDEPNVLVLGATPELRDMLALLNNTRTTVVDFTMEMILAMTELMENEVNEIWVKSDWLRAPLAEGHFDAIVGDLVLCNVPYVSHRLFVEKMQHLLRRGGHWITRVSCIDENTEIRNLEELFEEYEGNAEVTRADVNNFRHIAGLRYWCSDTKALVWSGLREAIGRYGSDGTYHHPNANISELLNRLHRLYEPFHNIHWFDTKQETDRLLSECFSITEIVKDVSFDPLREKGYYMYDLVK